MTKNTLLEKYTFEQFLKDIERGKAIPEDLLIDLFTRQEEKIKELEKELENRVYYDNNTQRGCCNCKHQLGGICEVLSKGTYSWVEGVSWCSLKHWEKKKKNYRNI